MNEQMYNEILDQVHAIRNSLPNLRSQHMALLPNITTKPSVIFTGSGDSYFAPLALQYAARKYLSCNVRVLPALEAARYWRFDPQDLLVAISFSGETARTNEAAQKAR